MENDSSKMSLPFQTFLKKLFLSFCLNSISWILAYSKCSDKFGNNFGNETIDTICKASIVFDICAK